MARIRTIKPEFFRHQELYLAEKETKLPLRIAFVGLWTAADREGRFKWIPDCLKLDCLPYDNVEFSRVLDALLTRGFIQKYKAPSNLVNSPNNRVNPLNSDDTEIRWYGWIPSFSKHQVINNRERPSDLPNPMDCDVSTRAPREEDACPTPLCLAQGEGKGKEGKGKERELTPEVTRQKMIPLAQVLFQAYQELNVNLPMVRELTSERIKKANARGNRDREKYIADFRQALTKAQSCPFLCGHGTTGWKADFDWFITSDTNVYKILEGKYDNNGNNKQLSEFDRKHEESLKQTEEIFRLFEEGKL